MSTSTSENASNVRTLFDLFCFSHCPYRRHRRHHRRHLRHHWGHCPNADAMAEKNALWPIPSLKSQDFLTTLFGIDLWNTSQTMPPRPLPRNLAIFLLSLSFPQCPVPFTSLSRNFYSAKSSPLSLRLRGEESHVLSLPVLKPSLTMMTEVYSQFNIGTKISNPPCTRSTKNFFFSQV